MKISLNSTALFLTNSLKEKTIPLLKVALSDDKSVIGSHAFQSLQVGASELNQAVLQSDIFRNIALELLTDQTTPEYTIGRLASLTQTFLLNSPEEAQPELGFIFHFLRYCGNPTVFNFWETITGDPRAEKSQQWLLDMGYSEYVARELHNFDPSYESKSENKFIDPILTKLFCIYQIIFKSATNPLLASGFRTQEIIDAVKQGLKNPPDFIISAQWKALNSLCTADTEFMMRDLIPKALQYLSESMTYLAQYRVSALDFIVLMMDFYPSCFSTLKRSMLLQNLTVLILQFQETTILHSSFRNFVKKALTDNDYAEVVVTIYSPIMMDIAHRHQNKVLSPTCFVIMDYFIEQSKKNPVIKKALATNPEWNEFFKKDFPEYKKLLDSSYGGYLSGKVVMIFKELFH